MVKCPRGVDADRASEFVADRGAQCKAVTGDGEDATDDDVERPVALLGSNYRPFALQRLVSSRRAIRAGTVIAQEALRVSEFTMGNTPTSLPRIVVGSTPSQCRSTSA